MSWSFCAREKKKCTPRRSAHPLSLPFSFDVPGGRRIQEKEATALNVTQEVLVMDGRREVRCVKEQKQERKREIGQRGSAGKLWIQWKFAAWIPACGCVWVFIDAPELGKSRARTNHSVAGIHYYRREYVPKSTPPLSLFSLWLPSVLQVKQLELFFISGQTRVYFMSPSRREMMKKSPGWSHTRAKIYFPV